jgi:GNAT superfamily N-acetyltransferase
MQALANIRRCRDDEHGTMLEIINAGAQAYRHAIPADCWHEPYMRREELDREIGAGVVFWGYDRSLSGVMGIQPVRDVDLIRHAYVRPQCQRQGIGSALLKYLCHSSTRRVLVGTWAAATWAIEFYRRHGFRLCAPDESSVLLRSYWTISQRQLETSVVLVGFGGVFS